MKLFRIIFSLLISVSFYQVSSQNPELSKYHFGEGLKFFNKNGSEIKLQGYIQPYFENKSYSSEDNNTMNRFRMRRVRLKLSGKSANNRFGYRFQVDLSGAGEVESDKENYLLDAYVSYRLIKNIDVLFGQRSTYTDNRELFMNSNSLQLVERSRLTSAFASIREFGFFSKGKFNVGGGSYLKPYFALTTGDGANVFTNDKGGLKVGGRLDYLPFGLFSNFGEFNQVDLIRELTPKLVLGVYANHNKGMSSRRGRGSGDILYLNSSGDESLPDYTKFGVDFLLKYKGFSALGEYAKSKATVPTDITDRVRNNGTKSKKFKVNGVQNVEDYVKGKMMLGSAYNFQLGYIFKNGISIDARHTYLNADENSFLNNATFYNRPKYYTIGVGKYLSRSYGAKIQASYTHVDGSLGINDVEKKPIEGNENIARIILTLSF